VDQMHVTPIAVIGMGCRLPGGIHSPELLWEALLRGDDLVTEVPADRWDVDEYYDPEPGVPGRSVCKWGAFLDDVADFDPEFFGINEKEATAMDPQHRLLLAASWEAMEHGGFTRDTLANSRTGVFMGLMHDDYQFIHADAGELAGPYGYLGNSFAMGSGRVAYAMGLHGPAMTVDTACSSGLTAIHLACRSLHDGESDIALAGGASVMLEPRKAASGSAIGMLSPTGRCHAFDVAADGFVAGEGCVVVMLKRLPDALADHDRVLAVIRGTAVNQDGHTVNIVTPSLPAQVEAYRTALAAADVNPDSVGMVEAHGPGTPVGDPIEYASLAEVYGVDGPCALASVKTNFGHTQSAAGALGLMKAVLALQHGVVPRNLHFTQLPDDFAKIKTNLFVPQSNTPWPGNGQQAPRRAAVSSYGFSGTNVHAILEQAPETVEPADAPLTPAGDGPMMFSLSATSADGLRQTAGRLADWVETHVRDLAATDLAFTLGRRRAHRPVRTAVFADTLEKLAGELREVANGDFPYQATVGLDDRGPVWIFSGQGSQWPAMGAELLATEPEFAAAVAEAEPLIAAESGFSVTEAISALETVTGIERIQPALFTVQVALAATMRSYGVRPGAVIGHSMGEAAAAVVAGALSLEDGVRVICRRSKLMSKIAGSGAMASVELPAQQVLSELMARGVNDDVVVAVVASPQSTVIGGVSETVRDLVATWEQREVMAREVAVDVASHSPQVDSILDELTDSLTDLDPMTPEIPFYSSTMFDPRDELECDAWYWADNLRHTVRFAASVQAALEDGYRVFAELAPHPLLTHAVEQTASSLDIPIAALCAMRREQELPHGMRGFLGDLYSAGAAIDFSVLHPRGRLIDAPLPTWSNRPLLLNRGDEHSPARGTRTVAVHPLMGAHVQLEEEPVRHVWQGEVGTAAQPWLSDHQIHNAAALPGATYCEMALSAARTVLGDASELCDIRIEQTLLLDDETPLGAVASLQEPGVLTFAVETLKDGKRSVWATAVLRAVADADQPPAFDIAGLLASHPRRVDGAEIRQWFGKRGLQLGTAFTGLTGIHAAEGTDETVLAEVELPLSLRSQHAGYGVHPALLSACFQSVEAHPSVEQVANGALLSPLGVRQVRAYGSTRNARYCFTQLTSADTTGVAADLDILDEHGTVLLTVRGLELGFSQTSERDRVLGDRLLTIEWQQRDLPEASHAGPGAWLLIAASSTTDVAANNLVDTLKTGGAECTSMFWPEAAEHTANASRLRDYLGSNGFDGVVVLTGPENGNANEECTIRGRESVRHLVRIVRELVDIPIDEPPRLYVVTRGVQPVLAGDPVNLEQAGLRGLMRVIGMEHAELRPTQIDLDEDSDVECLAQQLLGHSDEDETAWRNGSWYTARLTAAPLRPEERHTAVVDYARDGVGLQIHTPGDLETIELAAFDRVPPGPGEIEVAVTASSVNFTDVLIAIGRYPSIDGITPPLGMDFAGVVTAVGPDVTTHQIGDHVGGFSKNGSWATFVTCDARVAVTLPPGLTDEAAAGVSTAHATAWYALHDQARISAGDRVLIHSATGGVGQAAVAIAHAAGAEVFATAGGEKRRQLLRDMGIEHVYDSRSTEFAEQIRRDTDGYGVDVVLNSLTGAAQRAGLELLSVGGRFVEIGKSDVYANTRLELLPFRRNLTFHYVDLALMAESHPRRIAELLGTVYRLVAEGELPPPEITRYPLRDAAAAIRVMSAAEHTGKLVLDVPHAGRSSVVVPPQQVQAFRADGSYVVTGGLGGLGLFFAEKMAAAGCGRIVLSSRSQPNQKALETIELIRAIGADIEVECGDIAEPGTAERLVTVATATGLPLRGVLHAPGVFENAMLTDITDELLDRNWAAKVHGAWNLHHAATGQPLDWFCCFSSAVALVGSPGQGPYAAANSWLDAFAHWRRTQGLPATSIGWPLWAEVGAAAAVLADTSDAGAANATSVTHWRDTAITAEEGAYAFQTLLRHDRAYTGYARLTGIAWLTTAAQRSKFAERFQAAGGSLTGTGLLAELRTLPKEEWTTRLRRLVSDKLTRVLRRSIDPGRALSEYGLDSLANLELRNYLKDETGVRITPSDVSSVNILAATLYEYLTADGTGSDSGAHKPIEIRRKKSHPDPNLAAANID
jgi:acyl transferase domain-containing protein/NAD(P)-dependent dehydrogenase (short-subunit alcohol dehydrogenase family)/acyl carrier protein